MPTYEYVCRSCGTHVEVYQHFSDEPLTECGVCGGPLRKVFHPAGILFKGSGFYATDSRRGAARSAGDGAGKTEERSSTADSPSKTSSTKDASGKGGGKEAAGKSEGSASSKERSA